MNASAATCLGVDTLLDHLRMLWPRSTIKHVARASQAPVETVRGWFYKGRRPCPQSWARLRGNKDVAPLFAAQGDTYDMADDYRPDPGFLRLAERRVAEVERERLRRLAARNAARNALPEAEPVRAASGGQRSAAVRKPGGEAA